MVFNVAGAAVWTTLATVLGYGLGKRFPKLENYLTLIVLVIVAVSLIPVAIELRRGRRSPTYPGVDE